MLGRLWSRGGGGGLQQLWSRGCWDCAGWAGSLGGGFVFLARCLRRHCSGKQGNEGNGERREGRGERRASVSEAEFDWPRPLRPSLARASSLARSLARLGACSTCAKLHCTRLLLSPRGCTVSLHLRRHTRPRRATGHAAAVSAFDPAPTTLPPLLWLARPHAQPHRKEALDFARSREPLSPGRRVLRGGDVLNPQTRLPGATMPQRDAAHTLRARERSSWRPSETFRNAPRAQRRSLPLRSALLPALPHSAAEHLATLARQRVDQVTGGWSHARSRRGQVRAASEDGSRCEVRELRERSLLCEERRSSAPRSTRAAAQEQLCQAPGGARRTANGGRSH